MRIDNKNKYVSEFQNNNIKFIFYKNELYVIVDKTKKIAYIKDLNKTSLFEFISEFEIIENRNIESLLNRINII